MSRPRRPPRRSRSMRRRATSPAPRRRVGASNRSRECETIRESRPTKRPRIGGGSMPVKFDDTLQLTGGGNVMAAGPRDTSDDIKELCAWVYQRQGSDDAAATEMSTTGGKLRQPDAHNPRWEMELGKVPKDGQLELEPGWAHAVAVALIEDGTGTTGVFVWGETVMLTT